MGTDNRNLVGSRLAILVGLTYFAAGIIFFLMPTPQRPGGAVGLGERMASLADNALPFIIYYAVFTLGAVAALGLIPTVSDFMTGRRNGWLTWAANLAPVGFAVLAVDLLRVITIVPVEASTFVQQSDLGRFAISGDNFHLDLDPDGWLQFGAVGFWVLVVSLLNLRGRAVSSAWSYVGVGLALTYWLILVGNLTNLGLLFAIASVLGGLVLAPIWYIWLGISMRRGPDPAPAP